MDKDVNRIIDPWEARKLPRLHPLRCYLSARRLLEVYWYRLWWSECPWDAHLGTRFAGSRPGSQPTVSSHEKARLSTLSNLPSAVTDEHAELLFHFAARAPQGGDIVEIGSDQGKSTIALAWGAAANAIPSTVHSVDPMPGGSSTAGKARLKLLMANLEKYNARNVVVHTQSGGEYRKVRKDPVRLLFVDAAHDYLNSRYDFVAWKGLLVQGGYLIAHDVDNYRYGPGTRKAFMDCVAADDAFSLVWHTDNLAVAQRQ